MVGYGSILSMLFRAEDDRRSVGFDERFSRHGEAVYSLRTLGSYWDLAECRENQAKSVELGGVSVRKSRIGGKGLGRSV